MINIPLVLTWISRSLQGLGVLLILSSAATGLGLAQAPILIGNQPPPVAWPLPVWIGIAVAVLSLGVIGERLATFLKRFRGGDGSRD